MWDSCYTPIGGNKMNHLLLHFCAGWLLGATFTGYSLDTKIEILRNPAALAVFDAGAEYGYHRIRYGPHCGEWFHNAMFSQVGAQASSQLIQYDYRPDGKGGCLTRLSFGVAGGYLFAYIVIGG